MQIRPWMLTVTSSCGLGTQETAEDLRKYSLPLRIPQAIDAKPIESSRSAGRISANTKCHKRSNAHQYGSDSHHNIHADAVGKFHAHFSKVDI